LGIGQPHLAKFAQRFIQQHHIDIVMIFGLRRTDFLSVRRFKPRRFALMGGSVESAASFQEAFALLRRRKRWPVARLNPHPLQANQTESDQICTLFSGGERPREPAHR